MKHLTRNNLNDIKKLLKNKKFKKIIVITGYNSYYKSKANLILKNVLLNKEVDFFFKKSFIPDINELEKIILKLKNFKPDLILAVGGGAVLDYAKLANVFYDKQNLRFQILNNNYNFKKKLCPIVALPTTAGSGAEVTSNSVIYIDGIKYSVENSLLKPNYFFIIPEFFLKLSSKIKASAGFDALSQSIESIISLRSNKTSRMYAEESLKIIFKYFDSYLISPNKNNSFFMGIAANLSGKAIDITKTTAPHAVSYPFTSLYGIPHGHAVSLTLNEFLSFNYENLNKVSSSFDLKNRFESLFKLTNSKNFKEFSSFLKNIKKKAGLNKRLETLGVNIDKDLNKILSGVNMKRLKNNPISTDIIAVKRILLSLK